MPKKLEIPPDLINVNIRRSDFNNLVRMRRYKEPFYSILHRVVETRDTDKEELEYLLNDQMETTKALRKRLQESIQIKLM